MKTRTILMALCGGLLAVFSAALLADEKVSEKAAEKTDNFFKITTAKDFTHGTLEKVVPKNFGDGALTLSSKGKKYVSEGFYLTEPMDIQPGDWFTPSWNAETPDGTWVEVQISARVPFYDKVDGKEYWTDFLSMGKWGQSVRRGSTFDKTAAKREDDANAPRAFMDTDILRLGGKDRFFTQIRLKAILHTDSPKVAPVLKLLTGSSKNSQAPQESRVVLPEMKKSTQNLNIEMKFPAYSQDIRDKCGLKLADGTNIDKWSISCCICSPTTITGQINYRGILSGKREDWLPEEIALSCQDFTYGFGNWAYCCAAAGSLGYPSYARYGNLELLKSELAAGYPVGVGVAYTNDPNDKRYPYIENSPIRGTGGHLLLVRGFQTIDGVDYIFVNDSAARSDESSILRYKCDEFVKAWEPNCMSYIVRDKEAGTGKNPIVRRIPAKLKATKMTHEAYGREYTLTAKGKPVKLAPLFATGKPETKDGKETPKRNELGKGGVIGYTVEALDVSPRPQYEATANRTFYYTISSPTGNVYLHDARIQAALPKDYRGKVEVTVYVVFNDGKTYVAKIKK